jgi:hypothetical protein
MSASTELEESLADRQQTALKTRRPPKRTDDDSKVAKTMLANPDIATICRFSAGILPLNIELPKSHGTL